MFAQLNILQWELHLLPAALLLVLLLPYSSNLKIRYYGCFIFYIFCVSSLALILLPVFIFRFKNVRNCVMAGYFLKHVSKVLGIKYELRGGHIVKEERGAVMVSNHQSMLDILGMFCYWDVVGKCAAIARKELFYVWPFGLSAWLAGVVFIDRLNGKNAYKQLDETSKVMVRDKTKLWIFPEGTRNKNWETFLPFKRGAFRVAINSQVPIIPMVFSPYYFIEADKKIFGRGKITMTVLEPIETTGLTEADVESLMERTRDVMLKQYEQSKQEMLAYSEEQNKIIT